ncbi:TonB-dependent receptor, partial [bacterium]|nr:TonB-dependent receptor [bacterium]
YADSRRRNDGRGFANRSILSQMVANNEYKILLPPGQQGNISRALFNPYEVQQSRQAEVRALATGQLADTASLAVGTSTAWQMYRTEVDNVTASNNSYGGNGGNGAGSRSFQAAFTELSVFPVETVEVGLAARYDRYSDFGSTFNPKLSLSWQANDKLMFRTSIGTGFRAPNLGDLYNGGSMNFPYFFDTIGCNDAGGTGPSCSTRQYQVLSRANPNLKQETSLFQNFGFLLAPKRNWNIESNYFVAKIDDSVGALDMSQVMRAATIFGEDFLRDKYQIQIVRNGGTITQVNMLSAYNISSSIRQGLNFRVSNQSKANFGSFPVDFVFDMNHVQFLKTVGEAFPGLGLQNSQDNYFKNTVNLTGIHNSHAVRGTVRTLSGGDKNRNFGRVGDVGYGSLRTHTEFDINYAKQNIFKKINLNFGVKNLFDTPRPLDNTAQVALNTAVYDPIGRYYYTTLDYAF